MQPEQFETWIRESPPRAKCSYYEGMSLTDTLMSNEIRKIVWDYACKGLCYLVQKKHRVNVYEFIAIKASSPHIKRLVPLYDGTWKTRTLTKPKPEHLEVSTHG